MRRVLDDVDDGVVVGALETHNLARIVVGRNNLLNARTVNLEQ